MGVLMSEEAAEAGEFTFKLWFTRTGWWEGEDLLEDLREQTVRMGRPKPPKMSISDQRPLTSTYLSVPQPVRTQFEVTFECDDEDDALWTKMLAQG